MLRKQEHKTSEVNEGLLTGKHLVTAAGMKNNLVEYIHFGLLRKEEKRIVLSNSLRASTTNEVETNFRL